MQEQPTDRGTTRQVGAAFGFALTAGLTAPLLSRLGFGLVTRNALVAVTIVLAMLTAYTRRIVAEEAMLVDHLGAAYQDYIHETFRLLPGVY
jgi:protein-S-isoprenylcysteine O-methyltransferase Ste14